MQDRSFEEAMKELDDRTAGEILDHMNRRLSVVVGNTVSSTVTDIENEDMRAAVTDLLCLNKIIALLSTLTDRSPAELKELKDYLYQLHSRAHSPKGKQIEEQR